MDVEGNLIEFCYDDEIEDFQENSECYYGGPGNYYVQGNKENKIVDINTGHCYKKKELDSFEVECDDNENNDNNKIVSETKTSVTITYPDGMKDSKGKTTYTNTVFNTLTLSSKANLKYATRYFSYNTNGTCGSTAAAIFTYYYYDHISTGYITNSNYKGTSDTKQKNLVNNFKTLIGDDGSGTGYSDVKSGINKYLKSVNKSQNCTYVTKANVITSPITKIMNCIDSKKPCIVGLNNEPVYGDHWVVGVGYARYYGIAGRTRGYVNFIKVNNGWYTSKSKSIVYVNYNYIDGVIYLK